MLATIKLFLVEELNCIFALIKVISRAVSTEFDTPPDWNLETYSRTHRHIRTLCDCCSTSLYMMCRYLVARSYFSLAYTGSFKTMGRDAEVSTHYSI